MTRHGVPAQMNPMSNIRGGKIPDLQVVQAINHIRGLVAVTSPPPHEIKEVLPGIPVPKGKAGVYLVQLKDLVNKEVAIVDLKKKGKEGFAVNGVPMTSVSLKRKIDDQEKTPKN